MIIEITEYSGLMFGGDWNIQNEIVKFIKERV